MLSGRLSKGGLILQGGSNFLISPRLTSAVISMLLKILLSIILIARSKGTLVKGEFALNKTVLYFDGILYFNFFCEWF